MEIAVSRTDVDTQKLFPFYVRSRFTLSISRCWRFSRSAIKHCLLSKTTHTSSTLPPLYYCIGLSECEWRECSSTMLTYVEQCVDDDDDDVPCRSINTLCGFVFPAAFDDDAYDHDAVIVLCKVNILLRPTTKFDSCSFLFVRRMRGSVK